MPIRKQAIVVTPMAMILILCYLICCTLEGFQEMGDGTEDPYEHTEFFKEIYETFYFNVFTEDEVKFRLFGQTLIDKARSWYDDCPAEISNTWEELSSMFFTDFFPETRSLGARRGITNFNNRLERASMKATQGLRKFLIIVLIINFHFG
jgi:hypothetical protein